MPGMPGMPGGPAPTPVAEALEGPKGAILANNQITPRLPVASLRQAGVRQQFRAQARQQAPRTQDARVMTQSARVQSLQASLRASLPRNNKAHLKAQRP